MSIAVVCQRDSSVPATVVNWAGDQVVTAEDWVAELEHLREVAHLRPRTNTFGAAARVRNCLAQATHRFFHENDFYWIHTPIITASDAEGAGEMFRVSTLDLANLPRTGDGEIDFSQDFFAGDLLVGASSSFDAPPAIAPMRAAQRISARVLLRWMVSSRSV